MNDNDILNKIEVMERQRQEFLVIALICLALVASALIYWWA